MFGIGTGFCVDNQILVWSMSFDTGVVYVSNIGGGALIELLVGHCDQILL